MKLRKNKNKKLIKAAMNFEPFDYGFTLDLEKEALARMYEYFKVSRIAEGNEAVERDLKLTLELLEIIFETDNVLYKDSTWHITKYVNTRNWKRFLPDMHDLHHPIEQSDLRREKAWHLYNKLRYERMRTWWD